jgi:hypothetical protein
LGRSLGPAPRRTSQMKWLWIMCMAALLAGAPDYAKAQQVKNTTPATPPQGPEVKGTPAGTAKSFTPAERKAYEKATAEELDTFQQKITDLKIKATTGKSQNKRLLIRSATNLQMQQIAAAHELTALKEASESAWGPQQGKLEKAMEGLRQAFEPTPIPRK